MFAQATHESFWAGWELVAKERAWFNWIGHQWHEWCTESNMTAPAPPPTAAEYQTELAAKTAKLAQTGLHTKMKEALAGARKSKYNPKKGGKEKVADHPVRTVPEVICALLCF